MSLSEIYNPTTIEAASVESPLSERKSRKRKGFLPKMPDFTDNQSRKKQKFNFPTLTLDFLTPSPPPKPLGLSQLSDLQLPLKQLPPPKPTLSPSTKTPFSDMPFPALNSRKTKEVTKPASLVQRLRPPCVDLTMDPEEAVKPFSPKSLTKPKPTKSVKLTPKRKPKVIKPKRAKRAPIEFVEIPSILNYSLQEFKPSQLYGTWAGVGTDVFTIDKKLLVTGAVETQIMKTKKGYTFKFFNEVWKVNEENSTLETIEWDNMNEKATITKVAWSKIPENEAVAMNDLVGNWAGYGDDRFNVQPDLAGMLVVRHYELEKESKANVKLSRRRGKTLLNAFGSCWVLLNVVSSKDEVYWLRRDYKENTGTKYACWRRLILKK